MSQVCPPVALVMGLKMPLYQVGLMVWTSMSWAFSMAPTSAALWPV
jgi:hypothetical protein